jgi:hypothetical protein
MSEHLWMYEGVTEYFAIFSNQSKLILKKNSIHGRKFENANALNDTMPFTTMSANVLTEPYKAQYLNVYEKAHLLVCASISLSEKKSNGAREFLI